MWIIGTILLVAGIVFLVIRMQKPTDLTGVAPPRVLSTFWRPGIYNYDGNLYERAVLRNETMDFLLGKGVYYNSGDPRERCGEHEPYLSFPAMQEYASFHGNDRMLEQFERDIIDLLRKKSLLPEHFCYLLSYMLLYHEAYATHKLLQIWDISPAIKQMISGHINNYTALYGTEGGPFDCSTPRNEFHTEQAIRLIARMKEKFGVDLLHT